MKVSFFATHTLYYKVLIPLILEYIKKGEEVYIHQTRPSFFRYHPRQFRKKPTVNRSVNGSALQYVAETIGKGDAFYKAKEKIHWIYRKIHPNSDLVVGTVKDLEKLSQLEKRSKARFYALGYQHIPVLLSLSDSLSKDRPYSQECEELFLTPNPYSNYHRFERILKNPNVKDIAFVNFTYLDSFQSSALDPSSCPYFLIFHPGGYRSIVSEPGDSKETCDQKQMDFLRKTCLAPLRAGLVPVIKIHPLPAQFHDRGDVERLLKKLSHEDPAFLKVRVSSGSYWEVAQRARGILSFGSAGLYELFASGMNRVLIGHFMGQARSSKFTMFEDLLIPDQSSYDALFEDLTKLDQVFDHSAKLTQKIFSTYSSLPRRSVHQSVELMD